MGATDHGRSAALDVALLFAQRADGPTWVFLCLSRIVLKRVHYGRWLYRRPEADCDWTNMPFTTLSDAEEKELYRLQRFYWQEAKRCEQTEAYLAGCVMLGSALETS